MHLFSSGGILICLGLRVALVPMVHGVYGEAKHKDTPGIRTLRYGRRPFGQEGILVLRVRDRREELWRSAGA